MTEPSIAHASDPTVHQHYHGGLAPWRDETPPDVDAGRGQGRLRACGYCGSMHPADLVAALKAGANLSWSDFKYGWPHKAYIDGIPNPHFGMTEIRCWATVETPGFERVASPRWSPTTGERVADHVEWVQKSVAGPTTTGKFYTVHLQDATAEEREAIEKAMGLKFTFLSDNRVAWVPYAPVVAKTDPEGAADTQDAS